jgi:hypothetical protein
MINRCTTPAEKKSISLARRALMSIKKIEKRNMLSVRTLTLMCRSFMYIHYVEKCIPKCLVLLTLKPYGLVDFCNCFALQFGILARLSHAHFLIFTDLFAPSISTVLNTSPQGSKSLKISTHLL